ncbi:hypothetical protein KKG36_00905 [Patescibacteria group bacterium]|nr:hypothetical protein [Patescibacteria group bacterium]
MKGQMVFVGDDGKTQVICRTAEVDQPVTAKEMADALSALMQKLAGPGGRDCLVALKELLGITPQQESGQMELAGEETGVEEGDKIWCEINVGGTETPVRSLLEERGVEITAGAGAALSVLKIPLKPSSLQLVRMKVRDLSSGSRSPRQILAAAKQKGLGECPPETAPFLALALDPPFSGALWVLSKPVVSTEDGVETPRLFLVVGRDGKVVLSSAPLLSEAVLPLEAEIVVVK